MDTSRGLRSFSTSFQRRFAASRLTSLGAHPDVGVPADFEDAVAESWIEDDHDDVFLRTFVYSYRPTATGSAAWPATP